MLLNDFRSTILLLFTVAFTIAFGRPTLSTTKRAMLAMSNTNAVAAASGPVCAQTLTDCQNGAADSYSCCMGAFFATSTVLSPSDCSCYTKQTSDMAKCHVAGIDAAANCMAGDDACCDATYLKYTGITKSSAITYHNKCAKTNSFNELAYTLHCSG